MTKTKTIVKNMPFVISLTAGGLLFYFTNMFLTGLITFTVLMLFLLIFGRFDFYTVKKQFSVYKLAIASLIPCLLALVFCQRTQLSIFYSIANIFNLERQLIVYAIATLLGILAVYAPLYVICDVYQRFKIKETISGFFIELSQGKYRDLRNKFFLLFVIYLIGFGSLMLADVKYADDTERIAIGLTGFNIFSRWIAEYVSRIIHTDSFLADISPFPQIIATLIISIASFIVILIFKDDKKITFWNIIAVLPLGLSPYFLACFSFKYDAPYMALSILTSILPVALYKFGSHSKTCIMILVSLGVMVSACSYQASLGIFPLMIILLCFEKWRKKEPTSNILFLIFHSSASYLIGALGYRLLLMQPFESYTSSTVFPLKKMPLGVLNNISTYLNSIINDYDEKQIVAICIILISFVCLATINSKHNKFITFGISVATVCLSIVISFGVYIFLIDPVFLPRAMFGFSICISAIAIICTTYKFSDVSKVASLLLGYTMFVFSFIYSNALQEQEKYTENRTSMIINELKDLPEFNTENIKNIEMVETENRGISPIVKNMPHYDEVLGRMIPTWANAYYFYFYYDLPNTRIVGYYAIDVEAQKITLDKNKFPVLVENNYFIIYGNEENILIEWQD